MNLKKVLLSSVAAVTLASVAAIAAQNNAPQLALDQTGDYLVFPMYAADDNGNWSTNIKVVNSNTTAAIVAKVVFREYKGSVEKVDFPIFLSPGDVWEGTVAKDGTTIKVTTSDDSYFDGMSWASETSIKTIPFFATVDGEDPEYGYVEVLGLAQYDAKTNSSGLVTWDGEGNQLAKSQIKTLYTNEWDDANVTAVDVDSLFGEAVIFADSTAKYAMTLPAVAFEGVTGNDVVNPVNVIGKNTLFSNHIHYGSGDLDNDGELVAALEDAIAKRDVFVTFNAAGTAAAETTLVLTQPMKNHRVAAVNLASLATVGYIGQDGTDADTNVSKAYEYYFTYTSTPRNQEELSYNAPSNILSGGAAADPTKCFTEMCFIPVNGTHTRDFVKGWVDFKFAQTNSSPAQSGMPIIPVVMAAKAVSGQNITNIFYPAYQATAIANEYPVAP